MNWQVLPQDDQRSESLARELNLPVLIARLLLNRGLSSPQAISDFLSPSLQNLPSPDLMKDMDRAVARLLKAIREKEHVAVYGDYDADGITATALLILFLSDLIPDLSYYIPHRVREGYGLSAAGLSHLKDQGVSLIITVDCGISNHHEIELAHDLGMEVIVTDHHQIPRKGSPAAAAVLNPKQEGCAYPFKDLAGVGVAFYLVIGLRRALGQEGFFPEGKPNLRNYLDLVALGTVADIVPLVGVNRILVRDGLDVLSRGGRVGFTALKKACGLKPESTLSSIDLAFRLAPRVNALGRMQEAQGGVQMLISQEPEEAWALAQLMSQENTRRQALERQMIQEIEERWKANPDLEKGKSLVLSSEDWPRGILGLVASKLVERWARPVFLFTIDGDFAHGSGRSVDGLHLFKGLESLESYLLGYGGHAAAAGARLRTEDLPAFVQAFDSLARSHIGDLAPEPALFIEGEIGFHQLMEEVTPYLTRLSPFGAENPEPLLATRGIKVKSARIVGQSHLRLRLEQDGLIMEGIGFGMGDQEVNSGDLVDLAYTPSLSNNGQSFIQLRIKDIKKRN